MKGSIEGEISWVSKDQRRNGITFSIIKGFITSITKEEGMRKWKQGCREAEWGKQVN